MRTEAQQDREFLLRLRIGLLHFRFALRTEQPGGSASSILLDQLATMAASRVLLRGRMGRKSARGGHRYRFVRCPLGVPRNCAPSRLPRGTDVYLFRSHCQAKGFF